MSVTVETINQEKALGLGRIPAWFWMGAGVYLLQLVNGSNLLRDSDTYWHIAAGVWRSFRASGLGRADSARGHMHRGNDRTPHLHPQPSHPLDVRGCRCAGGPDAVDASPVCASTCACAARDGCLGERACIGEREPRSAIFPVVAANGSLGKPSWRVRIRARAACAIRI